MNRWLLSAFAASILALASPQEADAQPITTQIDAKPKGTIGLGLAGANVGLIVASVAGLDEPWAMTVFPLVGGAGGAIAGFFAIDDKGREKAAVGVLAGGIALTIPAVILAVKAIRFDPDDDYEAPPRAVEVSAVRKKRLKEAREAFRAGGGLIKRSESGLRFGMPAFQLQSPTLGQDTRAGARQVRPRGAHIALASGVF